MLTEAQLLSFYYNSELEEVDDYVDGFITATLNVPANDEFYRMVAHYVDACRRKEELESELSQLTAQWNTVRPTVWEHDNRVLWQKGKCGDGRPASGSYVVPTSRYVGQMAEKLDALTKTLTDLSVEKSSLIFTEVNLAKLKCDSFVQNRIKEFLDVNGLSSEHPAFVCFAQSVNPQQESAKTALTHCCTVLFHFERQHSLLASVSNDLKNWLQNLVSALNRRAFPYDHFFTLCHLLRCPQGVGDWAKNFVQPLSQSDFQDRSSSVNHFLAMLNILLNSIRKREQYLKEFMTINSDNSWAVVDFDGDIESDLIRIPESDLLSLLNQFCFENTLHLFLSTLFESDLTEQRIITLFAFALTVLKVLYEGLRTYNCVQYQQICRRIGLMMRQTVQCVAECYRYYQKIALVQSDSSISLQNEFDSLFCRSIYYIIAFKRLGVWQVLMDFPFDVASMDFRYRLVYILLNNDTTSIQEMLNIPVQSVKDIVGNSKILEQRLVDLHETDATYLLAALGNIICVVDDRKLVESIVDQVFYACFIQENTRTQYHKIGRQILRDVSLKYADTITQCFHMVDKNLSTIGGYALELMAALPLETYRCGMNEWSLAKRWLQAQLQTLPNALAQQVLLALNWKYENLIDDYGVPTFRLFLNKSLHIDVGDTLAIVHALYCNSGHPASMLGQSMKKAAKLASSVNGTINFEEQFDKFCWDLSLRLKLSVSDTVDDQVFPSEPMLSSTQIVSFGDKTRSALGHYVFFQTNCACLEKFPELFVCLEKLIESYQIKAAIACVCSVLPIFADNERFLHDSRWLSIIRNIIYADDTYVQYAKQLFSSNFPGENLHLFGNMLSFLSTKFSADLSKSEKLFSYILQLLYYCDTKQWNYNRSFIYLIDLSIRLSFLSDPTLESVTRIVTGLYEQSLSVAGKQTKGLFSKIFGEGPAPEIIHQSNFTVAPWFAFVALKAEECFFAKLFHALYNEMLAHPVSTVEQALKKICNKQGYLLPVERIPVFTWLQLCSTMMTSSGCGHSLLPLALQQLCLNFFQIRKSSDPALPPAVFANQFMKIAGPKYDTLLANLSKLTTILQENLAKNGSDDNLKQLELIKSILHWLGDQRLRSVNRNLHTMDVPLKFLFANVANGDTTFWLAYFNFDHVREEIFKESDVWAKLRHLNSLKPAKQTNFAGPAVFNDAIQRMLDRLKVNCQSIEEIGPILINFNDLFLPPDRIMFQDFKKLSQLVQNHVIGLNTASDSFNTIKTKIAQLNHAYFDYLPKLYTEIDAQFMVELKCQGYCQNPNRMRISAKRSHFNEHVSKKLTENRGLFEANTKCITNLTSRDQCYGIVSMANVVKTLCQYFSEIQQQQQQNNAKEYATVCHNGVKLFYDVIAQLNEQTLKFTATRLAYTECVEILGQTFICGNPEQVETMYHTIMMNKDMYGLLLPYFTPACADVPVNYALYCQLSETRTGEKFWRALLQKFDLTELLPKSSLGQMVDIYKVALIGCTNAHELGFLSVFDTYRLHCSTIVIHSFPQNFVDYVQQMLKSFKIRKAPVELLLDLLGKLDEGSASKSEYVLQPQMAYDLATIINSVSLESKIFCENCTVLGLMHCWRQYSAPIAKFSRLVFLSALSAEDPVNCSAVERENGLIRLFDLLNLMLGVWIEPFTTTAYKKIFPAWTLEDDQLMNTTFLNVFSDSLIRIQQKYEDTIVNGRNIFDLIWLYYTEKLTLKSSTTDEYIFNSYRICLLKLPWQHFRPNLHILRSIRKVLIESPQSAAFVTGLVVRIQWTDVVKIFDQSENDEAVDRSVESEFYALFLEIVIRCASDKANMKDCKASFPQLINVLCTFRWNLVDFDRLNDLLQYFVHTFGVDSVFSFEDDTCRAVLKLLERATEFLPLAPCQSIPGRLNRLERRRLFVNMLIRCLIYYCEVKNSSVDFAGRYLVDVIDRIDVLIRMIDDPIEKTEEASVLLEPVIQALNKIDIARYSAAIKLCLFAWIDAHVDADILIHFFAVCGRFLQNFAELLMFQEKCISAYFLRTNPNPNWLEISSALAVPPNFLPNFVQESKSGGHLLTLYAFFMQQLSHCRQLCDETLIIRDIFSVFEIFKEKQFTEPVILLYVGLVVELLQRQIQYGAGSHQESLWSIVRDLIDNLKNLSAEKSTGLGLLGAIGFTKKISYTPRLRLCCLLLQYYLQQQIVSDTELRLIAPSPDQSPSSPVVVDSKSGVDSKILTALKSMKSNKQFANFAGSIDLAIEYVRDPEKCLPNSYEFYSKLILTLYNEKYLIDKCTL